MITMNGFDSRIRYYLVREYHGKNPKKVFHVRNPRIGIYKRTYKGFDKFSEPEFYATEALDFRLFVLNLKKQFHLDLWFMTKAVSIVTFNAIQRH